MTLEQLRSELGLDRGAMAVLSLIVMNLDGIRPWTSRPAVDSRGAVRFSGTVPLTVTQVVALWYIALGGPAGTSEPALVDRTGMSNAGLRTALESLESVGVISGRRASWKVAGLWTTQLRRGLEETMSTPFQRSSRLSRGEGDRLWALVAPLVG